MILFGGTIYIPGAYEIYCSLIIELLQSIINLEKDYFNKDISEEKKLDIVKKIKYNLKLIGFFLEDKKNEYFINTQLPININNNIVSFENTSIIDNFVNPLVVFVTNFKLNWIKYNLICTWQKNGGTFEELIGSIFIVKKDLVFFINELEKKLSGIDKIIIKKYIGTLYNSIEDNNLKLKLNTFQVYSVIKNNINIDNPNKIFSIEKNNFIKLDKYYKLGINAKLLTVEETNRIYNTYEKYYEKILPNSELSPVIINNYNEFLELQGLNLEDKDKKIKIINIRYYSYLFDKFLANKNYKKDRNDIIQHYNFLKKLKYNFKKEQSDKVKTLNVKLNLEGNIPYQFNADNFFPLFYYDELCKLKNDILVNEDKLCEIIKKIYPMYNIGYDLFCSIDQNGKKKYLDKETINKTINFYCVVFLIIGIVNFQLKKYDQDYMIILKGGKALQLILSEMNFKDNTIFKSNDIDLIISPSKGKKYFENKCKNLGINICLLIQWILNPTKNMYDKDYYVSYKLQDAFNAYKYVIKLSHKIQYSTDISINNYTAIADFDFGEIDEKNFYSNLIINTKNSNSVFGELLFIHQNLSEFLLEKIYYININVKYIDQLIVHKNKNKQEQKKIEDEIKLILIKIEENNKEVNNSTCRINKNNDIIKINEKKINDYDNDLQKIKSNLYHQNLEITNYQQHFQHKHLYKTQRNYRDNYDALVKSCNYLSNENKKITNYNIKLSNEIKKLIDDNKINNDKIKNSYDNKLIFKKDLEKYSKTLKIIEKEIYKISADEKNTNRFIKKFSNQIKFTSELITKNESFLTVIHLDKQKEYIKKLIKDNNEFLKFDDITIDNIIKLIFI